MNQPARSPSYLIRNPHSYCFRMIVPKDLRNLVGKTELRYSLKTGYLGVAKNKARLVAGQIQLIFKILRKGGFILSKLSDDQIQALVNQYIKDWLEALDKRLYEDWRKDKDAILPPFVDYQSFRGYIESLDDVREQIIVNMHLGEFVTLEDSIDDLLKKNGINQIDKDSLEFKKLCVEIHKAATDLLPIEKKHILGDFSYKAKLPEIFPEVSDQKRKTEDELWKDFESARPEILGALLDAVSGGLKNYKDVKLQSMLRMADFEKRVVAAESKLPWKPGKFIKVYRANREESAMVSFESDVVAIALKEFIEENKKWEGTTSELKDELESFFREENFLSDKFCPKRANHLSNRIRRIAPSLRSAGISVDDKKVRGLKYWVFSMKESEGADN